MNAAAEFKTGFGTQFNGLMPTISDDSFYSYSTYNNWATKVPSPLGTKPFWPVVPSNHHQSPVNCFNAATSVASMGGAAGSMLPGSMGTGLTSTPGAVSGQPCPYTTPANPYTMYHHRSAAEPCTAMSSSIASLRLKAKQHTGFVSYPSVSPVRSSSAGLQACQYASGGIGVGERPGWDEDEALGGHQMKHEDQDDWWGLQKMRIHELFFILVIVFNDDSSRWKKCSNTRLAVRASHIHPPFSVYIL